MSNITNSTASQSFKSLLWATDYMLGLSSIKAVIDFAISFWNPNDFDQSSPYVQAYFEHLDEKKNSRYIAVLPIVGNVAVLVQDCYQAVIGKQESVVVTPLPQDDYTPETPNRPNLFPRPSPQEAPRPQPRPQEPRPQQQPRPSKTEPAIKRIYREARAHQAHGQMIEAWLLFERAARANHLSSILETSWGCLCRGDAQTATYWFNRARGRCHSASKMSQYRFLEERIREAARFHPRRANPTAQRQRPHQSTQGGAHVPRVQTRAEKEAAAAAMKPELVRIFGEFSTADELHKKWTRWGLKAHPDRGGPEEEFKRVTNLVETYKSLVS